MANGAAEALLDELLRENKEHSELLRKIAGGISSGGGGSGAGGGDSPDGIRRLGTESKKTSTSMQMLGGAIGGVIGMLGSVVGGAVQLAGAGFTQLVGITKGLAQAQMSLAETAIAGTGNLSSFYDSLSGLPGILGLMARVFAYQAKVVQQNIDTFQKMADSGAILGGNLDQVRASAKGMYLSMDEFANVMKANTPAFLYLGQTANDGAKALIKFNTQMIQGSTGRALLGMGYSLEEANNMLGLYSATLGGVNEKQMGGQKGMEASVKMFATELALSAELEGKSRKQKEDEMKERAAIAARENMLSKMTKEQKEAYLKAELAAGRAGGKAAQDALLSATLGLPPMTQAARTYTAMHGEAAKKITDMVPAINSTTMTAQERERAISKSSAESQMAQVESAKRYGKTLDAISFGTGATSEQAQESLRAEARARNQNLNTAQDVMDRENKSRKQLTEAQESQAGAVAQAAGAAKYQGEAIMDMLGRLFEPLRPVLLWLVNTFLEFAPKVIAFGSDLLNKVIIPLFKDLFGDISFDEIFKPFKDFFKGFFGTTKLDLGGVEKGLADILKPLVEGFRALLKAIDWVAVGKAVRWVFDTLIDVGKFLADVFVVTFRIAVGIINVAIGVFNVLSAIVNVVIDVLNWFLEPLYSLFDLFSGPVNSALTSFGSLINDTILPFLDTLGQKLTNFADWIDRTTQGIQGPLKTAFEYLRFGLYGIGAAFLLRAAWIGAGNLLEIVRNGLVWAGNAAMTIWNGIMNIGAIVAGAWNFIVAAGTTLLGLFGAAVSFLLSPLGLLLIAGIGLAVIFKKLYDAGWDFSTVLGTVKNKFADWIDNLAEFIDNVRGLLPAALGGLSDEERASRAEERKRAKDLRDADQAKIDRQVAAKREERNKPEAPGETESSFRIPNISNLFSGQPAAGQPPAPQASAPSAPATRAAPKGPGAPPPAPAQTQQPMPGAGAPSPITSPEAAMQAATAGRGGAQTGAGDAVEVLNRTLPRVVTALTEIADNTKRTANAVASGGNMFRK